MRGILCIIGCSFAFGRPGHWQYRISSSRKAASRHTKLVSDEEMSRHTGQLTLLVLIRQTAVLPPPVIVSRAGAACLARCGCKK